MFYNNYITNLVLKLGGQTTKVLDKGSIELIGPFGLEKALINLSKNLTKLSTGVVTSYGLYILVGLISFIFVIYLSEISSSLIILLIILASFSLNENKQYFGESSQSGALPITGFKTSGFLSKKDKKLFSTLSSSDTELLALFRSSCIIDNLNESILKLCHNKKIDLKSDLPPCGG